MTWHAIVVAVRVNYGQMPGNVHAFVGYIALAGAEGGLWSIEGGNFILTQELIKLSQAKLVMKRVIGVKRDDKYSSSGAAQLSHATLWHHFLLVAMICL